MVRIDCLVKRKRSTISRLAVPGLILALSVLLLLAFIPVSFAGTPGTAEAWGQNDFGQCNVPAPNSGFAQVAAGYEHSLGLKSDGTVVAWGDNIVGQCNVPAPNSGFAQVAAGYNHSLGLKSDGTVVAWGDNGYGQCNVPAPNSDFVQVSGGGYHSLGLKSDGTVVAWGRNSDGQCIVPAPNSGFAQVSGGGHHSLGLKSDGTVVAWGENYFGQCNVPAPNSGFAQVSGGGYHSLGLKSDGTVVAWGYNDFGQCNVPAPDSGFVQVSGGAEYSLGLKSDGTVVAWGDNTYGQCNVPAPNSGFVQVSGGGYHSLSIKSGYAPSNIAGCEPTSVVQGHTVNIDITGNNTRFKSGESKATFSGTGITVNSTDVTNANHACANITVATDAPTGQRDVNVITNSEVPTPLKGVFTVKKAPPKPHLDSLAPKSGTVGTHVMLSGEHFGDAQGQSYVTFNGTKANSYNSWSDGIIVCNVPSGATTGPVTVTTPAGTSNGIEFTVTKPHVPKITDVSPNAVHQGDTGVDITITGEYTHFEQGVSAATFSGTGITVNSTTVGDSTHASANVTVALDAPTGNRDVNVITGTETPAPLVNHFIVQPHGTLPPRLDGISPAEGTVGDQVTLSGGNFGSDRGSSQVTFHQGVAATEYSSWADDKIICKVPAGATTGPVTVTTTAGTSGGKTFTVVEPRIKDCEPRIVVQGHKVELDVLGEYTHFENGKSMMVVSGKNGVKVGSTYASDATHASANVTVALDAAPGTRDVDVVTGSEHPEPLSNVFTIKKKPDNPPAISGLHPAEGPVGTQVSITGKNFGEARGSSTVTFNGTPVTNYVSWSDHDIICNVPLGAETGEVKVQTPWGTSNGMGFTVDDFTFYFAEGTCRPGFAPYLTIQNPDPSDAKVKITYMLGDGTTQEQDLTIPATTRATVTVTDTLGAGDDPAHDFSAMVECTNSQAIVAERPMYFDYGIHQGLSWTGGSDVIGALSPSESFYFAEGTCRPGFQPYLTIQNPNATDAQVKITYMLGDGTTTEQDITVPATTRSTVTVTDTLGVGDDPAHDFSCKVECTNSKSIVVERPMYFSYGAPAGLAWTGGSDVVGALSPAEEFFFAEGTCRPGFSPYLTIQNPASTEAAVVITYMRGDGANQEQAIAVPAHSRSTVTVADILGSGDSPTYDFSCKVASTNNVDIIAERPMYFNYQGAWTGGSDVVGALSPAGAFYFAEGTCRPGFAPYLTIQNPGLAHAQVKITYMKGDGTTTEQEVTVGAQSRYTVFVTDTLGVGEDAAHDFSCTVECTNNKRIIAERPMYFNYNGVWTGGSDVVGFAP